MSSPKLLVSLAHLCPGGRCCHHLVRLWPRGRQGRASQGTAVGSISGCGNAKVVVWHQTVQGGQSHSTAVTEQWRGAEHPGGGWQAPGEAPKSSDTQGEATVLPTGRLRGKLLLGSVHLLNGQQPLPLLLTVRGKEGELPTLPSSDFFLVLLY